MNFTKNSEGITLIALVVTIIILLILAGVTLKLVAGGDGILKKASKAVDATVIADAKERTEMLITGYGMDFHTQPIFGEEYNDDIQDYIKKCVDAGKKTGDYFIEINEENKVIVYKGESAEPDTDVVTGTLLANGDIVWDEVS